MKMGVIENPNISQIHKGRSGPPRKGAKCYFRNRKVRKRECAIRPVFYIAKAVEPVIFV